MKITFFELEGWENETIKENLKDFNDLIIEFSNDVAKPTDAEIISIFIRSKIDKEFIDASPNLKLIITRSAGMDHVDIEYANSKGIIVKNCPNYSPESVAEFSFLLLLSLMRKYNSILREIQELEFDPINARGHCLYGKRIGIIGTGKIGSAAAKIAMGFGMNVFAYDVVPKKELIDLGVKYVEFNDILKNEILSFYVPLIKETYHLINMNNVKLLNNAIIVNVSRGPIIELDALLYGLEKGNIKGLAMDVIEGEKSLDICKVSNEISVDSALQFFKIQTLLHKFKDRVILTPHFAYNTYESIENIWKATFQHIRNYLNHSS